MMPSAKMEELSPRGVSSQSRGFSLVELLVTMTIFSILMTGIFQAYNAQIQHTSREYNIAESDIDRQVGQGIVARDIFMAGYGLADDYGGAFTPWALQSANGGGDGGSDTLTLMGTALGMNSQQAQHWSYVTDVVGSTVVLKSWSDAREDIQDGDRVILIEPATKRLLTGAGASWLFQFNASDDTITPDTVPASGPPGPPPTGTVLYGLGSGTAARPYYSVRYYLQDGRGDGCAPGVNSLLRAESVDTEAPSGGTAIIPCVADFQVAIGLDTNNDRAIDVWQNGGAGAGYDPARLNRELRQVRVYALTQIGERDRFYTYPTDTIQVGESSLGAGVGRASFALDDEMRKYRWRVIRFVATPRNIR